MTTIAAWVRDGVGTIASDTRVSSPNGYAFSSPKLLALGKSVFGGAGGEWLEIFFHWLASGRKHSPEHQSTDAKDFAVIEVAPDGLWLWGPTFTRMEVVDREIAVGSGELVALYTMRYVGLTPAGAVEAASMVDSNTGGRIDVKTVKMLNLTRRGRSDAK